MKIKYISDDYELYLIQQRYSFQYDLIIDCISKKDNFTMYKVQKTCRSDPSDIIYHAFYYDHQRKHTPLDIAVNSRTNIIEYISFFVSDSMKILIGILKLKMKRIILFIFMKMILFST